MRLELHDSNFQLLYNCFCMLKNKLFQFRKEIQHQGAIHFIKTKITEQFYKQKFKKLAVDYGNNNSAFEKIKESSVNKDSKVNQASSYYDIKKAFAVTGMDYADIRMVDIGCGNGKVLNFGMYLNFKEVVGFDLDLSATQKALANCNKMKQNGSSTLFSVFQGDAASMQIPPNTNLIYLFNPFGNVTMAGVVENIIHYLRSNKKELFIVYAVPVHQALFLAHKEFIKIYERMDGADKKAEMAIFKVAAQLPT